jgi:hypothetical protein
MKMPQSPSPTDIHENQVPKQKPGPSAGNRATAAAGNDAASNFLAKRPILLFLLHSIIVPLLACAFYWH